MDRLHILTFSALFGLFASYAQAIPIVTTADCVNNLSLTCATGIDDLDVGLNTFDVTFISGSYTDIYSTFDIRPMVLG
jgi:hypothetical protein